MPSVSLMGEWGEIVCSEWWGGERVCVEWWRVDGEERRGKLRDVRCGGKGEVERQWATY